MPRHIELAGTAKAHRQAAGSEGYGGRPRFNGSGSTVESRLTKESGCGPKVLQTKLRCWRVRRVGSENVTVHF